MTPSIAHGRIASSSTAVDVPVEDPTGELACQAYWSLFEDESMEREAALANRSTGEQRLRDRQGYVSDASRTNFVVVLTR
jgi:hypothetical protein